jgi:hypothetical protein
MSICTVHVYPHLNIGNLQVDLGVNKRPSISTFHDTPLSLNLVKSCQDRLGSIQLTLLPHLKRGTVVTAEGS